MAAFARGQKRILFAKDGDLVGCYGQNQLELLGYRATVASRGWAALSIIWTSLSQAIVHQGRLASGVKALSRTYRRGNRAKRFAMVWMGRRGGQS